MVSADGPGIAGDAARFQAWMRSRQYPRDCRATVGHAARKEYFWLLGLGAQMVALKYGLLNALLTNRVYHLPTTHYTNPLRCPSRSFECYFERPTNCTPPAGAIDGPEEPGKQRPPRQFRSAGPRVASEHGLFEDVKIHWCFDVPRRQLASLANLSAVRSAEWYHAQIASFLFRPNSQMTAYMSRLPLERSNPASNASLAAAIIARERGRVEGPRLRGHRLKPKKEPKPRPPVAGRALAELIRARGARGAPWPWDAHKRGKKRGAPALGAAPRRSREPAHTAGAAGGGRGANAGGLGSCMAMHVRRTDKHTEDHRTAERTFGDFSQIFKSWAYWKSAVPMSRMRVLLGSEDPATFRDLPPLLAPSVAAWLPGAPPPPNPRPTHASRPPPLLPAGVAFAMDASSSARNRFRNIKQSNARLAELYGLMEDEAAAIGLKGDRLRRLRERLHREGGPYDAPTPVLAEPPGGANLTDEAVLLKDEGIVLIAQMLLMARCDAFAGSYASNVAVLVHDLMLARREAAGAPLHAMDVNGRVYCGCGASFCMTLERKAIRDPTLTIKKIVDGFKY